jgi:hypothetical protein
MPSNLAFVPGVLTVEMELGCSMIGSDGDGGNSLRSVQRSLIDPLPAGRQRPL